LWPRAQSIQRRDAARELEEKGSLIRAIIGHRPACAQLCGPEEVDPIHGATVELEVLGKRSESMNIEIK
jgi:hypothetical protein